MGRLTGEKVLVVKYSFLISEKTLVRKAGMKRWEGEWNETFLCWSCAQREEQARPFVWTTKTAFVVGHSNKGTGGICVKNRVPASEGTCEARLGFNAASQFNKTPFSSSSKVTATCLFFHENLIKFTVWLLLKPRYGQLWLWGPNVAHTIF